MKFLAKNKKQLETHPSHHIIIYLQNINVHIIFTLLTSRYLGNRSINMLKVNKDLKSFTTKESLENSLQELQKMMNSVDAILVQMRQKFSEMQDDLNTLQTEDPE